MNYKFALFLDLPRDNILLKVLLKLDMFKPGFIFAQYSGDASDSSVESSPYL